MFFKLLSVAKPLNPFSFRTTLEVSFFDLSLMLPLIFYLLRKVPVDMFIGFPLSLLANAIGLNDFIELFESSEYLLLVSRGSSLSLKLSCIEVASGSGLRAF
jgi:hypothetical protein